MTSSRRGEWEHGHAHQTPSVGCGQCVRTESRIRAGRAACRLGVAGRTRGSTAEWAAAVEGEAVEACSRTPRTSRTRAGGVEGGRGQAGKG